MKGYDPARHKHDGAVSLAHDTVQSYLSALLDPDNEPGAVFPFAIDSLVALWRARIEEEATWQKADAQAASDQGLREAGAQP